MSCNTTIALTVEHLRLAYGTKNIVHDISFTVPKGQVCGLLGPNGSGKSTLFKGCLGFLPLQQGSIRFFEHDVTTSTAAQRAKCMAYVPQEHRQAFPYTVKDMVLMGRSPHLKRQFGPNKHDEAMALSALGRVGLAHLASEAMNHLSGGQRQLVLIARALAQETPLLLLDEPTSALDFSNQMAIWTMIRHVASEGKTVMVCCHDPNHMLWFCDRVLVLKEGQILADGAPKNVLTTAALHAIYGPCCTHVQLSVNDWTTGMVCPLPLVAVQGKNANTTSCQS